MAKKQSRAAGTNSERGCEVSLPESHYTQLNYTPDEWLSPAQRAYFRTLLTPRTGAGGAIIWLTDELYGDGGDA